MAFGEKLKKIRKEKGLSIRKVSELSNISHAYISQIESGKRGKPKPELLKKLSKALNIPYAELMVKAGYFTEKEWNSSFIQEDFNIDEDAVCVRASLNQQSQPIDLIDLLENKNTLTYNGHDLMNVERKQILDMLAVLFPLKTREKRTSENINDIKS